MHLSEQDMQLLNKRLHFSADLLKILLSGSSLYANRTALNGLKPSQSVELLEGHALRAVEVLHKVLPDGEVREQLGKYLSEWRHVKSSTTGHDLKKLDIEPGPKYAEILRRLRAAWLDGEVKSEEEEKMMLQDLIKQP
jgi:tRNA nucleotidyltransferase (CCA-adding enzyme)